MPITNIVQQIMTVHPLVITYIMNFHFNLMRSYTHNAHAFSAFDFDLILKFGHGQNPYSSLYMDAKKKQFNCYRTLMSMSTLFNIFH